MGRGKSKATPKTFFAKRLKLLIGDRNNSDFEKNILLTAGTVARLFDGSEPTRPTLEAIIKGTGCDAAWLLIGEGKPFKDEQAAVSLYQVEKQAETKGARLHLPPMADIPGPKGRRFTFAGEEIPTRGLAAADDSGGTRVPDTDDFGEPIHFPSGLIGIPVVGDSMSPVILSGQYVEVDMDREGFERDRGIYVVSVLEPDSVDDYPEPISGTFVKRCERHENLYYLESINGDYSPFSVHVDHCRIWPVLGVWFGGKGTPPEGF